MTQPHAIQIEHAGRRWSGSYEVRGKGVHVASAYGSKATQIGGMKADALARQLLGEIVRAYLAESGG
jgi:hypothetical protein